jgi:DNA uptake protein ComE-like DNA-binding protein
MHAQSASTYLKTALVAALALVFAACSSASAATDSPTAAAVSTATNISNAVPVTATAAPASTTAATGTTPKINLNTASAAEILTVPNAGQRMVREFMEYRPYTTILQFRQEIGKYVDAATIAGYEQYVYVPVDINQADTATLQQLPGVDDTIANALVAARPYASVDAFLSKLGSYVSAAQAAAAKSYLGAG